MPVLVINPNSNTDVTDGLAEALKPLDVPGGPGIECVTLASGPYGIETQAHIDEVVLPLRDLVSARNDAEAFVIACYSDPGLEICREAVDKPVFGIQESGVLTALALGDRFGVIALGGVSIKRHLRYLRRMGVDGRLANERAASLSVEDSASGENTVSILTETGKQLRDLDGADVLVLGCAGMAKHRAVLEAELGIPVVDPVQAACVMALGHVMLR